MMNSQDIAPLIPAATVVLIKDSADGLHTLLLRRNKSLKAFGGVWVFPGGRVDETDGTSSDTDDHKARIAACRETHEETGLHISIDQLISLSHWIPPVEEKRRFSTRFYVAPAPDQPVKIDQGEIHDFMWVCPKNIIATTPQSDRLLMPPTYISLYELSKFDTVASAIAGIEKMNDEVFETKFVRSDKGFVTLWQHDAAYETLNLDTPGARRRLVSRADSWDYQKDFS